MNLSALITSLVTSFIIFLFLALLFIWLSRRPGNFVVYYPSRILKGLGPPENAKRRGPFDWIREAWQASEEDIISQGGLDAAVYLIFLSRVLTILVFSAIFCLPVLIPLSRTSTNNTAVSTTDFDKLAMGNIPVKNARLWAFAIGAYWMSITTYFVLWKTYKHVMFLRAEDQSNPKATPGQYTVLVRDIPSPKNGAYAEEVDAFFTKLHPDTYEQSMIVTNIDKVSKIWTELETSKRKLAHAEAVFAESKTSEAPEGTRPQHKTGTLGLIGPKVDSIDFYTEKIKELRPLLEEEQKRTKAEEQQGAALAFFKTRSAATVASQTMHGQFANAWTVMPAPEPPEVVWENLPIPLTQRLIRQFSVYGVVFLTVCFYMIPISLISAIISLDNLQKKVPFMKSIVKVKPVNAILQAYLPQLALLVFLALLPMLLMKLSRTEGIPSEGHLVRAAAGKYFYFNVFNVFLGVTIAGTLFNSLSDIIKKPSSVVNLLSAGLPPQATFFITYVALKFLVGYGLELTRLVPLIIYHLKRKYLCKTEQELRDAWEPSAIGYATTVPGDMLVVTIALCYTILAPMILPFSIAYFALGWLVMRNQVLNVYVPKFESGGRMWPHMHSRILAALFVSQLTMVGYFGVKKFKAVPVIIPLPIATLVFAYICRQFFYPSFNRAPLSLTCNEVKEVPSLEAIVEAYTPTCLLPEDQFEDPEKFEDARSNISSRTASSVTSPA